jgi:hypothetical protein
VSRACACMRDLDRISPGEQHRQRKRASHAFKPHSISLQIQNLILNPQSSQLARRAANPRRAFVVGPLVSLPAICSRKKTPSGRCRRRATGHRVCSRSRPGCRRSAPRPRRPSTTLSLLQSPNWLLSEPHLASRSTHSRGQRFSGPTLLIAGSRYVRAVASEPNN